MPDTPRLCNSVSLWHSVNQPAYHKEVTVPVYEYQCPACESTVSVTMDPNMQQIMDDRGGLDCTECQEEMVLQQGGHNG